MFVKVCGLSTPESAATAVEVGADAIGVVMSPRSSRHVDESTAREVISAAKSTAAANGTEADAVLVVNDLDAGQAAQIADRIGADVLQLHGPAYDRGAFAEARAIVPRIWRATSLDHDPRPETGDHGEERLLLDAPRPGGGATWDLSSLSRAALRGEWLLAGGLRPENVLEAIARAHPWGVDVSSGVESAPGVKDPERIRAFVQTAKSADLRSTERPAPPADR